MKWVGLLLMMAMIGTIGCGNNKNAGTVTPESEADVMKKTDDAQKKAGKAEGGKK